MASKKKFEPGFEIRTQVTDIQKKVINFFRSNSVSILTADPGCGKSHLAIHYAITLLLSKNIEKIVISKPLVEVGSSIGFLPGTEDEKVSAYMDSYAGIFEKILGDGGYRNLMNSKKLEFVPVNFCRGTTIENAVVIMDEAQGLTLHELMTFVTRVADTSRMMILGDPLQVDIKRSGFETFIVMCDGIDGIGHMELGPEYQMRSRMITDLYDRYKKHLKSINNGN